MSEGIFEETWNEVTISPESAMRALMASLRQLSLAGRSTPPSYVAKFIKKHSEPVESIVGSSFDVERVELPGITFYEITLEDLDD